MYAFTAFDRQFVHARAAQYRDQLERHLAGNLPDEDFRPLRLQNGWYVQRHAPMLRVAVPYGALSSAQLRGVQLAIRHCYPQHRCVALHIPAVLQAQRAKLVFRQRARLPAGELVAVLVGACFDELAIEVGVLVHIIF